MVVCGDDLDARLRKLIKLGIPESYVLADMAERIERVVREFERDLERVERQYGIQHRCITDVPRQRSLSEILKAAES